MYVYSGNDPINRLDPDGRIWQLPMCLYYMWNYSDVLDECKCEAESSCAGDKFLTDECQSGSGGWFQSKVNRCIERRSPGALAKLISWCGAFTNGWKHDRTGGRKAP